MDSSFCNNLGEYGKVWIIDHKVGAVMLALGLLYFLMSLVIIYFIKIQEYYARSGNDDAVRAIIFPIFVNVLWANALVNIYVGIIALTFTFEPFRTGDVGATWSFSTMYALQHLGKQNIFCFIPCLIDQKSTSLLVFLLRFFPQYVVTEGVALLLMQKGLGVHAATVAFKWSAAWAVVTLGCQYVIFTNHADHSFAASMIWQSFLTIFYGCLWLLPQRNLFRRPAVIYYARTWFWFRLLCMLGSILFYIKSTHSAGSCLYVMGNLFPFAIFEPLLMYYTLLQDSKWWQGQDIFQGRRVKEAEEIRSPLQGIDINLKSAQSLAASMDRMGKLTSTATAALQSNSPKRTGTLGSHGPNGFAVAAAGDLSHSSGARLESDEQSSNIDHTHSVHGGGAVRLLNFAYISLDKTKQLGTGSFSRVYLGRYRRKPCAVKLIFTVDLTIEVIQRVAAEAQLLSLIRHPNVVDILGVSVLPPSVCILLELCSNGSLGDTLRNTTAMNAALCAFNPILENNNELTDNSTAVTALSMRGYVNGFNSFVSYNSISNAPYEGSNNSVRSESSNSNVSALMSVVSGATNGSTNTSHSHSLNLSAALSNSQPVVTAQQMAALSLTWTDRLYLAVGCARGLAALHTFSADLCHRDIKSFNFLLDSQLNAKISDLELGMAELLNYGKKKSRTVGGGSPSMGDKSDISDQEELKGNDILANWCPPEVIQGSPYTQASDVYGFALVLWEILVGRVPFSEVKRQDEIRRRVVAGHRPLIPGCFIIGENSSTYSKYIHLMQRGWDADPRKRPSASAMLNALEDMWLTSGSHLICTTDATHDDGYSRYHANATRTGSITVDDPYFLSTALAQSQGGGLSGSVGGFAYSGAESSGGDDGSTSAHTSDLSYSRGSYGWLQGSFGGPKSGVGIASAGGGTGAATVNALQGGGGRGTFSSAPPAATHQTFAHKVLQNLRAEDENASLHALEASGGCYVLTLPVAPHEVVWATHAWCQMSGCLLEDIIGRPLHTLPVFDSTSFVKLRSGSQRKGTLAAEFEAPRSRLGELFNAATSIFGNNTSLSAEATENANATSVFFKSISSRYLHRTKCCHAVINLLDFSCRTYNMMASQKQENTFSRRIAARLSMLTRPVDAGGRGGGGAGGGTGTGAKKKKVIGADASEVVVSPFSVYAFPVYQRSVATAPVPIPQTAAGKTPTKNKSGLFNIGSFSKPRYFL